MPRREVKFVISEKLSKKDDVRYVIVDKYTGKVLDDANGYGYHSIEKAQTSWEYKGTEHYKAIVWLKVNKSFLASMDYLYEEVRKGKYSENVTFDEAFISKMLNQEGIHINFSVSDLLAAWKTLHAQKRKEKRINKEFSEADNPASEEENQTQKITSASKVEDTKAEPKLYGYIDKNSEIRQVTDQISFGEYKNRYLDKVFYTPVLKNTDRKKPDGKVMLLNTIKQGDVIITTTLTNFSLDFVQALSIVLGFTKKGARVIAKLEDFDTAGEAEQAMLSKLSAVEKFKENSLKARTKMRNPKVYRELYHLSDFPNFYSLYNSYMNREITKTKFAETLGISTTTLNRLIAQWERGEK